MTAGPRCWVVVPCYNEAARLPVETFAAWLAAEPGYGLLFIDDGSTDDTAGVIDRLAAAAGPRAVAHTLPVNGGKAEAVRQGLALALDRFSPDAVGYLDADLATGLEELVRIRAALDATPACDIAIGSRIKLLGRDIRRKSRRHYFGRLFATMASLSLGLAVYDTQCGAKLFRVRPWTRSLFAAPFISRWIFDVEILARYLSDVRHLPRWPDEPCGIVEVPLLAWRDVGGSKVRGRDFFRAAVELIAIVRRYRLLGRGAARRAR